MISKFTQVNESSPCEQLTVKIEVQSTEMQSTEMQNLEYDTFEKSERVKYDLILGLAESLAKSKYLTFQQVKNHERCVQEFFARITVCEPNTTMNRTNEMFVIETTNGVERFSEDEITEALMKQHPERFV